MVSVNSGIKRKKGQFFLVGAILLCTLFFAGMPPQDPITAAFTGDLSYLHENIGGELPRALNLGINQSRGTQDLLNFTRFVHEKVLDRNINLTCAWFAVEYLEPGNPLYSDINITIGNFLDQEANFTLNISVGSSETLQSLVLADNTTGSLVFQAGDISSIYNLTVSFNNFEKKITLPRGKTSIYSRIVLTRGEEKIINEITG